MTQSPSQIMYATTVNVGLRGRIEAIVRVHQWNNAGNPTAAIGLDSLVWAVATNPTIYDAVSAAIVDGNIGAAVAALGEDLLQGVVLDALQLALGGA
ncbi:hypothetical protein [Nocardioides jensenii]|uniref:hypothetical protein n=1 Tax=Nocardioides jensenii TaxID=1843 RepID=UPI000A452120|nr:hypothetical protein [Nocardioides jensenii]